MPRSENPEISVIKRRGDVMPAVGSCFPASAEEISMGNKAFDPLRFGRKRKKRTISGEEVNDRLGTSP